MVLRPAIDEVLTKVKQLCQCQGFVYEVSSSASPTRHFRYGPSGALLRRNILHEWYQAMVTTQGSTHLIEESPVLSTSTPIPEIDSKNGAKNEADLNCVMRNNLSEGCLSHYLRILELNNQRFPFSIGQTGVYRNNKTSQTFLLSSEVQTGMTLLYFCPPSLSTQVFDNWQRSRLKWWRQYSPNPSNFSLSDIQSESGFPRTEILYDFSWGKDSIETITNRGDQEVREMEEQTGLSHQGKHGRKSVFPVTVECSSSLERAMLAVIMDAYTEQEKSPSKDKATAIRTLLRINRHLAPYKVALAVSGPGGRELREVASHLAKDLRNIGVEVFDAMSESSQSLESRIARFDELGIPFSVILNASTLKDGIVGLRNRDTILKEQVHISRLKDTVWRNIKLS